LYKFDMQIWSQLYKSGSNSTQIFSIEVDTANNIWISINGNGIFKYDGTSWLNYNTSNSGLSSNNVYDISFTRDYKHLWIASNGGTVHFDLQNNKWEVFNPSNSPLCTSTIDYISVDSKSNVWMAQHLINIVVYYPGGINSIIDSKPGQQSINCVYPNPANNNITIKFTQEHFQNGRVEIYDLSGKMILKQKIESNSDHIELNTENWKAGIYSYKIIIDGNIVVADKLVIVK